MTATDIPAEAQPTHREKTMKIKLSTLWLVTAVSVMAQQQIAPFKVNQANQVFYAGQSPYTSIQSAVTKACSLANPNADVQIQPGVTVSGTPTSVSGCSGVFIHDFRTGSDDAYKWNGAVYVLQASTGGTVTSVGDLTDLFTTNNPTAAVTFTKANAPANSVYGRDAGTGAPTWKTAPAISAANMTAFPILNQNTSGNAATATTASQLAGTPSVCSFPNLPSGIDANGNAKCDIALGTAAQQNRTTFSLGNGSSSSPYTVGTGA